MRNLDFYEFVGIVVPGVAFILSIGILWPDTVVADLLLPTDIGATLVHLVAAYGTGHLLQGLGNIPTSGYWRLWGGLPSEWAVTHPDRMNSPDAVSNALKLTKLSLTPSETATDVKIWRGVVAMATTEVNATRFRHRILIFNGNYGMFRGLVVAMVVLACSAWSSDVTTLISYPIIGVIGIISLFRMHQFSIYYAKELHASIANLVKEQ